MKTATHFFTLPSGYESIELAITISFENELLYELHLTPYYQQDVVQARQTCVIKNNLPQNPIFQNYSQQNLFNKNGIIPINKNKIIPPRVNQEDSCHCSFARHVFLQLAEYFLGKRKHFDIPLCAEGTAFQQSVWRELLTIPYGTTCSYKDIAQKIGNPKACRAVGLANNKNPINIIIPCHRVIGSNGALMGYAGQVPVKSALLSLENTIASHT